VLSLDQDWSFDGSGVANGARIRAAWHQARVTSLAWSWDGRTICSAGRDGTVRVWDLETGELRWQFERRARHLALSPDGTCCYALSPEGAVWPFDLVRGEALECLWSPPSPVRRGLHSEHAFVSADGRWLFPACDDGRGSVLLVDLQARMVRSFAAPGAGELRPVGCFTLEGAALVLLGGVRPGRTGRLNPALYRYPLDGTLPDRVRALRTGRERTLLPSTLHRDPCSVSARWLLVGVSPAMLARWCIDDDRSCDWIELPTRRGGPVLTGERVAVFACTQGHAVGAIDHATGALLGVVALPAAVSTLALAPDERSVVVGTEVGEVRLLTLR
jgi:WD40 repeat protein